MRESVCVSHSSCKKPIKEVIYGIILINVQVLYVFQTSLKIERWLKVECFD